MSAAPLFDVTVTHSGREEHVLRLGAEGWKPAREALLLNYVRQAEALGIDVVHVLSDFLLAEDAVRAFEQRKGGALDAKRFPPMRGSAASLAPEEWKALDLLADIIRNVPRALSCLRVRNTLEWLRVERLEHAERDLPALTRLLDEIGGIIARPRLWSRLERRISILRAWEARSSFLSPDARDAEAKRLKLGEWKSLAREARRYIAENRRDAEAWLQRRGG